MPKTTVTPSAADLSSESLTQRHKFRGREFTFRELTITEYDAVVQKATGSDGEVNQQAFARELVRASIGMKPDEYATLGTRLARQLGVIATRMHWAEEPDELTEESDDEGDSSGNVLSASGS